MNSLAFNLFRMPKQSANLFETVRDFQTLGSLHT